MKKLIIVCITILAGLWLLRPVLSAVFAPRTQYYPEQKQMSDVEYWPNITPRPTNQSVSDAWATVYAQMTTMPGQPVPGQVTAVLVLPSERDRVPYTIPPGVTPFHGMPTITETPDRTNELTAVNRNLENAVKIVEACAVSKAQAALEMPPRWVDCEPAVDNLEAAKQKVYQLQDAIRAGGGQ